jgi:hypothetical protein
MSAVGTLMATADPFLHLSPLRDLAFNLFGLGWAYATPESESHCGEC